ncbi:MAG: 3-keto-5-aminohexanoate cleavage protein [Bacteroidetes bacterium]|nr:MAG: 3-keto-5-aminohexanoate cleavage protein [Bacteroidota bacterium]
MGLKNKLILNFTPTGMIPTKAMTPHVPVSVSEIVEEVHAASELGITLVHLHARDAATGEPTYRKEVYGPIMEGIRQYCPELVLCLSLSGRNFNEFAKRSEAIELRPDMGSLTLSSLNFPRQASVNEPDMIQGLAAKMAEYGVHPELEVFDLGMIHYAQYLIRKALIRPPYYVNIITGNLAGMQTDLAEIGLALKQLPPDTWWALGGIGRQQLQANAIAIAAGGGVRVGLEDNLYFDRDKNQLARNIDLLKRVHALAELFERPVMSPAEFGQLGFYNPQVQRGKATGV